MKNDTALRRGFTSAVAATVLLALTSCSADVAPPSQDLSKIGHRSQKVPAEPPRTTLFGPHNDLGTAKHLKKDHGTVGGGTRNRLNFRDRRLAAMGIE